MNRISLKLIILALGITLLTGGPLFAWGESNPRAMAMGGAYTALSLGNEASAHNPANLGLSINRPFTLDIVSVGLAVKNNSFSLADYNKYTGQFLDDDDKEAILDKIPAEGLKLDVITEAGSMSFSTGHFGLSVRALGASKLSLDKDPFELLLYGNAVKSEVNLSDTKGEAYAIGDAAFSYGRPLMSWSGGEMAVGASFHYLRGIAYEKIVRAEGGIATTPDGFVGDGEMLVKSALGGQGLAFDLGVSIRFEKDWFFSGCWQNIYSQINWNRDTEEMLLTFDTVEPLNLDNMSNDDSDSLIETNDTTYDVGSFSSKLPTVFKLGLARNYKKFTWAIDWEQGTAPGASQAVTPRIGTGLEYRLADFFPLRVGTAFGGDKGTIVSTGFGVYMGPLHVDMAVANNGSFNPAATKGINFAFALGLKF